MLRYRNPTRSTLRTTVRSVNRAHRRIRWRTPDDLGAALAAWGRAVRAHRRLVRLAPRFFDPAVVDREAENRAEQRRWQATWEPDLARVYGVSPQAPTGDEETPRLPPHHIQHAVERQLAKWQFWMEASRAARKRHNQRHPHALRSLGRVARMMQLAIDFGNRRAGFPQLAARKAHLRPPLHRPQAGLWTSDEPDRFHVETVTCGPHRCCTVGAAEREATRRRTLPRLQAEAVAWFGQNAAI